MKDDAVIKDNEAVYLLNEQTYLHLRENLQGVGYEVFDKNSPLPVEEGQIPREALGNTQRRIETARAYYLAEHQDEPVGKIQNVAVTTLEKFRSGVRRRRNLAPGFAGAGIWLRALCRRMMCGSLTRCTTSCSGCRTAVLCR